MVKRTRISGLKKGKRAYDSSRRQAQAAETQRQIVEAARRLFTERGYAGTTIEAIAGAAGVAAETVYAAFGSKRAVLQRLVGVSLVGDDKPIPMVDRPIVQAMIREPDQRRQIQLLAQQFREISERVGPVWWVMRAAEQGDPEIASMVKDGIRGRFSGMSQFAVVLSSKGPLREGLTTSGVAETVWAVTSPDVHHLLTVDRGWSGDRYEQWVADTLIRLLLP
jgi:AcrR family transcriptional regulator